MTAWFQDPLSLPVGDMTGIDASIPVNEVDENVLSALADAGVIRTPVPILINDRPVPKERGSLT